MVGEIGGDEEEKAAEFIAEQMSKPVVAYIAGFTAPPGKTMGHAGAIISGSSGTAQAKKEALEACGVRVGTTPTEVAQLVAEIAGAAVAPSTSTELHAPGLRRRSPAARSLDAIDEPGTPLAARDRRRRPSRSRFARARLVPTPSASRERDELADCARPRERDGATLLSYGPAGGYAPLREWIAERHGVEPRARVVLTNGSLQGFRFLAELLSPTGTVIVEAPTYDRPLKILARARARDRRGARGGRRRRELDDALEDR